MKTIRNFAICIALFGIVGSSLSRDRVDIQDPTVAKSESSSDLKRRGDQHEVNKLLLPTLNNQSKVDNPVLSPLEF